MLQSEKGLIIFVSAMDPMNEGLMVDLLKVAAAVCLVADGHERIIEAVTVNGETSECGRFQPIMEALRNTDNPTLMVGLGCCVCVCACAHAWCVCVLLLSVSSHLQPSPSPLVLQEACMQFINAVLSVPEEVDFKVHLRNEFIRLGLEEQKPVSADLYVRTCCTAPGLQATGELYMYDMSVLLPVLTTFAVGL